MSSPPSLLPARTTPGGSQHEILEKALAATATSTSTDPPGRWRGGRAKRTREEINKINERTEKAAWEKQFDHKLSKMAEESVKRQLSDVKRQPRPSPPPTPASRTTINTAESVNPMKRARKPRTHSEEDNPTFSPSDSDENPWANLPAWTPPSPPTMSAEAAPWVPPPAAPPRAVNDFIPPKPTEPWQPQPPPPPQPKAPPTPPTSINVVKIKKEANDYIPLPPPAPWRPAPPTSTRPIL